MNKRITLNDLLFTFLEYLLAFSVLLASNSIYWYTSNRPFKIIIFTTIYFTIVCLVTFCLFKLRKNRDIKKLLKLISLNLCISLIIFFYNKLIDDIPLANSIMMIIFPLGLIVYFYYYISNRTIPRIFFILSKLIFLLAIVSLFFYFLFSIGLLHSNSSLFVTWGLPKWVQGLFYVHFFPQGQINFLGINVIRNTGIYTEAPMYSFVLSIGLILYYFIEKPKKLITLKSFILIFTMITTTSTTGLMLLISAVVLKLFITIPSYYKILIIGLIPVVIFIVYMILKSKFTNMGGSVSLRINDFYAGYQAFIEKPLMGNGMLNGENIIKKHMDFSRLILGGNSGFSSGLLYGLARIGFVGMSFYVFIPFLGNLFKNINIAAISILVFILFTVTVIFDSYLFTFFLAFFFTLLAFTSKELEFFD